jgi:ribosome biogenesis GTPase
LQKKHFLNKAKLSGRVVSTTGTWNRVATRDKKEYECSVRGRFKVSSGLNATHPVAVGDKVYFTPEEKGKRGVIEEIEERKNYLIRASPRKPGKVHIIAANIDQAAVVATVDYPRVKQGFIDRFLVTAEAYDIQPLIVLNKNDCYGPKLQAKRDHWLALYRKLGYPVVLTSAENQKGLDELQSYLHNRTTLVNGHSGVGKSTLLNTIYPDLNLKTADISKTTHKGKHTTTFSRMHAVDNDRTFIIDTPGIKEFGLVGFEAYEIGHFFPEMREYLTDCKFNNCLHAQEPGCAVKQAVEEGEIDQTRYESYLRIIERLN